MADDDKKQAEVKEEEAKTEEKPDEEQKSEEQAEAKEEQKPEEKKEEQSEEQATQQPKEEKQESPSAESDSASQGKQKPTAKLDKKLQDLADKIEGLSLAEAATLAKALQEKFGITTAPVAPYPTAAATPGTPAAGASEQPVEEQTIFNVVLTNSGTNKISVIKALREINTQLGLKEAKDIADAPPKEILSGVNKATADEAKGKLEAAGATVELK